MTAAPLALFEGIGIEIESAVVDAETLDVRSVVDELLRTAAGTTEWVEDHDDGPIGWSNELVTHVVELKTNGPVASYTGLAERFHASTCRMNALLERMCGARLLPTGMHPWMDSAREARIWPHEHGPVYRAYDKLFDCRRHGWANLQSVHLNLSFAGEEEFARLMAAARLVLPLIPALAASSPIVEGRATGVLDNRLVHYRGNATRVPSMAGDVVPEPIFDFETYRAEVFAVLDRDLEAVNADPVLRGQEWTNARGAITRFDRMAIEIRLIDAQECNAADLAVAAAVGGLVRAQIEERWRPHAEQREWDTEVLAGLLSRAVREGPHAVLREPEYAAAFGLTPEQAPTLGHVWRAVAAETFDGSVDLEAPLQVILEAGTLAERILLALGPDFDRAQLRAVYGELADCLAEGRSFRA